MKQDAGISFGPLLMERSGEESGIWREFYAAPKSKSTRGG
jgi:hypothetical protein